MTRIKLFGATAFVALALAGGAIAANNPMVGGGAMYASKNIVQNAVNSKDHTTLVAAVKAAGLVDTLQGPGPFTVFAPTNEAFDALPTGTVDTLLKPENKAMLTKVLTYHVVPGRLDSKTLDEKIKAGGGKAMLKTVEGETSDPPRQRQVPDRYRREGRPGESHDRRRLPEQRRHPGRRQGAAAEIAPTSPDRGRRSIAWATCLGRSRARGGARQRESL